MRLLICTQTLDSQDSNLGFFHRWIEEFAAHCERVTVICLREGAHVLPDTVRVYSLGKVHPTQASSWWMRLVYAVRFSRLIRRCRADYDAVFVHMNPEYVLLGGKRWRAWGKRVGLWYAHKSVTKRLVRAVELIDRVFTVSTDSFRVSTPKLCALGHGVDTELFRPENHLESTHMRIVTTGRIAGSKHLIEMLGVLDVLHARGEKFSFTIVGDAKSPEEERYAAQLKTEIAKRPYADRIELLGAVSHHELPALLHTHDVFFNFSGTGNMDKAGLEALAVGLPLLTTNEAFEPLVGRWGLYVHNKDPEAIADALLRFLSRSDQPAVLATLRNKVVEEHSLSRLIPRILKELA